MGRPMAHNLASAGFQVLGDRKSTRLNSSHLVISYAVFCLKKKEQQDQIRRAIRDLCAGFGDEYWRELDRKREYPERFVRALTDAGWLGALIPADYGGAGLGVADAAVILEEINRSGGNAASAHAQMYTMGTIIKHRSADQKRGYMPRISKG